MTRSKNEEDYLLCLDYAVRLVEKSPYVANYHKTGVITDLVNSTARDLYLGIKSYGNTGTNVS